MEIEKVELQHRPLTKAELKTLENALIAYRQKLPELAGLKELSTNYIAATTKDGAYFSIEVDADMFQKMKEIHFSQVNKELNAFYNIMSGICHAAQLKP